MQDNALSPIELLKIIYKKKGLALITVFIVTTLALAFSHHKGVTFQLSTVVAPPSSIEKAKVSLLEELLELEKNTIFPFKSFILQLTSKKLKKDFYDKNPDVKKLYRNSNGFIKSLKIVQNSRGRFRVAGETISISLKSKKPALASKVINDYLSFSRKLVMESLKQDIQTLKTIRSTKLNLKLQMVAQSIARSQKRKNTERLKIAKLNLELSRVLPKSTTLAIGSSDLAMGSKALNQKVKQLESGERTVPQRDLFELRESLYRKKDLLLNAPLEEMSKLSPFSLVEPSSLPGKQVSPGKITIALGGLILGLAIAVLLILMSLTAKADPSHKKATL